MEPLENEAEAPLLAALRIDLIMWKVEAFLELEDLKSMRLVSRAMNQLILCQPKFVSNSKLVLTETVYKNPCFKSISFRRKNLAFKTTPVGWNCWRGQIRKSKTKILTHLVCKLTEGCEYLEIQESGWLTNYVDKMHMKCKDNVELDELCLPEYFPRVLDLILHVENLKELKCCIGSQVLFNQAAKDHKHSLSSLTKIEFDTGHASNCRYPRMCCPPILFKLKGLMTILGPPCYHFQYTCEQHERFRDLVVNNRETLIELDLEGRCDICCSTFFVNIFPSLKSLKLIANDNWERNELLAAEFLGNHIQNLEILSYTPSCLEEDNVSHVFANYTVPCMKKLKLQYDETRFVLTRESLLRCMTHIRESLIEDFRLKVKTTPWYRRDGVEEVDILSLLPTSLRSLILKGNDPTLTIVCSKLKHFPHLTHLDIRKFVGPLNSTLEAIFKYLVKLRSLYINCETDVPEAECNSAAEPGDNPTGSTILTFNLMDLETIDVWILNEEEGGISMDIINRMKCSKLKTFYVRPVDQEFSPMTLVKLFQDNPCLSSVLENVGGGYYRKLDRETVMKDYSDLAQLTSPNFN